MDDKNIDIYRLHYHLMPPLGSLADPNGMCQIDDVYHIYYVHNPLACLTKERTACVWGHYSTKDFVHFKQEKNAIESDTKWDCDGVYSGSSLYEDGKLIVFYTGNVRYSGDYDYVFTGREQNVLSIESEDCVHFKNKTLIMSNDDFPGNMTKHVRDPQVFKEDDMYYMVLGARNRENAGLVLIYESQDMKQWSYINQLTTSNQFGYMWECPDLIQLDQHRILIACPQGIQQQGYHYQNSHQCGYFEVIGDFKNKAELSAFEQFDYGFDFYAARTFLNQDGERILVGWMGMSETHYTINQTYKDGWMQAIAMPRILTYKNHHIYQKPIKQMKALRQNKHILDLSEDIYLEKLCFELIIKMQSKQNMHIRFREDCYLDYDCETQMLSLKMDTCGDGRDIRTVKIEQLDQLQIFSDTSSLEIFINDGYCTMTSRIFGHSHDLYIMRMNADACLYELSSYDIEC